MDSTSGVQKP